LNLFIKEIIANINPQKKGFKKKVLSFTFFLLISTAFWILNALGEKYTEKIKYPIIYKNLPKDKEIISELPKNFELKITTNGYSLLEFYLNTQKEPISINYKDIKRRGDQKYTLSKYFLNNISVQLPDVEIHSIAPDSIKFNFQQIITKKVHIQALATYKIKKGFVSKGNMYTKPDSVEISGAKDIINQIQEVYTGVINLGEISKTSKRNIAIKKTKGVRYKTYRTNVYIPIEQATERIVTLPIQINNNLNNDFIKLIPNTVNLSYKVGLSQYTFITKEQFIVSVTYSDSTQNNKVLKVELTKHPDNIYEIDYTPKFVEFIREKND